MAGSDNCRFAIIAIGPTSRVLTAFVWITEKSCFGGIRESSPSHGGDDGNDGVGKESLWCDAIWDTVTCWPPTPAGQVVEVPCPLHFAGVDLPADTSENATRLCYENGTWELISNYSQCLPPSDIHDEGLDKFATRIVYYTGFVLSNVALIISLVVFIYFRSLRCLRNTVHCHLFLSFIFRNLFWMLLYSVLPKLFYYENNDDDIPELVSQWFCKCVVMLFNYFVVTNFFWMLVEGLYLHTMIVCPFAAARVRLWHYAIIGWGLPSVFIAAWAIQKNIDDGEHCWLPKKTLRLEFIYVAPILLVLFVNLLILANIVWILVTKLRESKNLQTVQYRVAVKSTLVLLPLLGVTYLIFLISPSQMFEYVNAVLQSTQGFVVALFYCFLNGEVQSTLKSWAKNLRDDYSVQTLTTDLGRCILCTAAPPNGGGGQTTANSSCSNHHHHHQRKVATSITELTKQDLELQSNIRHQATSYDDDDDDDDVNA